MQVCINFQLYLFMSLGYFCLYYRPTISYPTPIVPPEELTPILQIFFIHCEWKGVTIIVNPDEGLYCRIVEFSIM